MNDVDDNGSLFSTSTRSGANTKRKIACVTDESFAIGGNLASRMIHCKKHALKAPTAGAKHRCAIHRWASNRQIDFFKHACYCNDCNIHTRVRCHELLIMEPDMLLAKKKIALDGKASKCFI